ncbi:MAG: methyltransferase domain-containing protein [Mucilaginibacter polytrichastri]|nr:methyltransferase domain-containing protein [Mucilaginibacter polytrichastri]
MNKKETLPSAYFDKLYTDNPDPWSFETSAYEEQKYAATVAALPRELYESALEIGCSIGVLTLKLAQHCSKLLSIEPSLPALDRARARLANVKHVTFQQGGIPDGFPPGHYQLIVLSEVGYYLSMNDLRRSKVMIENNISAHGDLVLVHWTHFVEDYPLNGHAVHDLFIEDRVHWQSHLHWKTADYRLDVLKRLP